MLLIDASLRADVSADRVFKNELDPEAEAVAPIPHCLDDMYIRDENCTFFLYAPNAPGSHAKVGRLPGSAQGLYTLWPLKSAAAPELCSAVAAKRRGRGKGKNGGARERQRDQRQRGEGEGEGTRRVAEVREGSRNRESGIRSHVPFTL